MTKTASIPWDDKSLFISEEYGTNGTIIAIHGLTGSHKNMVHYARHLMGDYRIISVDLRGRGNSSAMEKTPSIFQHAEDILHLVNTLQIDKPIFLGHSMGAFISTIIASKLPSTKAVILLDGAATMSDHQDAIVQPSLGRLSKKYTSKHHYLEEIKNIYNNLGVKWTTDVQACAEYEVAPVGDYWENRSNEESIRKDWESFYTYEPKEICSNIKCPVLFVYAEGNNGLLPALFRLSDYENTLKSLQNVETFISDCNHYTMVFEKRDDILQAIDEFLEKFK